MSGSDHPLLDRENPWPGLLAFTEEARDFFSGREAERDELFRLIRREQLTLLYGHSGFGKTSLVRAGLFPLLRADNFLPVFVRIDHRRESPAPEEQMLARLVEECRRREVDAVDPAPGQTLWEYLHSRETEFWSSRNRPVTPVFVLDQFEEVFTLGGADPQRSAEFLAGLGSLINNDIPPALQERLDRNPGEAARYVFRRAAYRIVVSLREDFLPELEDRLRDVVRAPTQSSVRLRRMSGQQARDALLATGGHLLEADVATRIVRFLATRSEEEADADVPLAALEIEPALLSVFARELNEQRKVQGRERIESGLLQGTRAGILSAFYRNRILELDPGVRVFVEEELLTDSGFRDSYALEDALRYPGVTLPAIERLIDQRILRREERFGTQRIELTHDVLTRVVLESRDDRRRDEEQAQRRTREAAERARLRKRTRQLASVAGVFVLLGLLSLMFMLKAQKAQAAAIAAQRLAEQRRHSLEVALAEADSARADASSSATEAKKNADTARVLAAEARASAAVAQRREAEAVRSAELARQREREALLETSVADGVRITALEMVRARVAQDSAGLLVPVRADSLRRTLCRVLDHRDPPSGDSATIARLRLLNSCPASQ